MCPQSEPSGVQLSQHGGEGKGAPQGCRPWRMEELVGNSEKREPVATNLGPKVSGLYSAHKW